MTSKNIRYKIVNLPTVLLIKFAMTQHYFQNFALSRTFNDVTYNYCINIDWVKIRVLSF